MRIYGEAKEDVFVTLQKIDDIVQLCAVHANGLNFSRGNICYIKNGELYLNECIDDTVIHELGLKVDEDNRIKLHNGDGRC
jgi:hypothetical protein